MSRRKPKHFRPGGLIKKGHISRTRLNWWLEKGYITATGPRSKGGGIAGYTAREAIGVFLMEFLVEQEGYQAGVASLIMKNLLAPVRGDGNLVLDRLRKTLTESRLDLWLVSVGTYPGPLVIANFEPTEDPSYAREEYAKFTVLNDTDLYVPKAYLDKCAQLDKKYYEDLAEIDKVFNHPPKPQWPKGIRFYHFTALVRQIASLLEIEPEIDLDDNAEPRELEI